MDPDPYRYSEYDGEFGGCWFAEDGTGFKALNWTLQIFIFALQVTTSWWRSDHPCRLNLLQLTCHSCDGIPISPLHAPVHRVQQGKRVQRQIEQQQLLQQQQGLLLFGQQQRLLSSSTGSSRRLLSSTSSRRLYTTASTTPAWPAAGNSPAWPAAGTSPAWPAAGTTPAWPAAVTGTSPLWPEVL